MARHVTSEARSAPAGVAIDVAEIRWRRPAAAARPTDDARASITFRPAELAPWRVRVDFLVYFETDPPGEQTQRAREYEYVPVGCELAVPISINAAEETPEEIQRRYAEVSSRFVKQVTIYHHHGELLLRQEHDQLADVRRAMVAGKAHKHHPLLVADYRARKGAPNRTYDMAAYYNVHRTTIYRALQEAAAKGFIPVEELEHR